MNYVLKAVMLSVSALLLASCSKSNDKAPNIDPRTGKHPAGWAVAISGGDHPAAFRAGPSSCYECHGEDLSGGISKASCFSTSRSGITCHANGPGQHPSGWSDAAVHGAHAKNAATGADGFSRCQVCHGSDYSGGIVKKSCLNTTGCHGAGVSAPHAAKPWLSRLGASNHATTDAGNASACAVCHAAGVNSARAPSSPAPAGTAPGCFNSTLCHGVEGHATGWNLPANHGAAAKAPVGGDKGFGACAVCHGANYAGGTAQQSCLNTAGCHGAGVNSPHPATPWQAHSATDTGNSPQCAVCHTNGANSTRSPRQGDPVGIGGCFNNTLCHGVQGHAVGWAAASAHGAEAKKAPGGNTGFSSCQPCHGTTFNNGTAPTCMNNASCHGSGVNSPHAGKPWFSRVAGQPTHTTTDVGNVGICAACHTGGANSTLGNANAAPGTAGCFNNTLCHFHEIPFAPSATVPVTLHSGEARKNLSICQGCHGQKGTTAFDGATLSGGATTIACSSCHTSARAHPTDWQGSGTFSHRTAGNINVACIICHDVTQGRTAPLEASPSCFSATFTNGAAQTRTCHASGPGVAPHIVPYNNHNATARSNFNYCLGCHQVAASAAGSKPPGCRNCHLTSPVATPTGCTSCHARPPAGNVYPDFAAVHASHSGLNVTENPTLTAVCDQCHNGLGFGTVDHLNRARARTAAVQAGPVVFGTLATTGSLTPTYTAATQTCAATYCHGSSLVSNLDPPPAVIVTPSWNTPFPAGTHCDKCHGYPPVTASHGGVSGPTQCIGCHSHVNATGTGFGDPTKHINGAIDVTGGFAPHSIPLSSGGYPGSLHKSTSNSTGCRSAGCHPADAAGSSYPAAAGTAPNCRSCHLNAGPSSDPRCSDCHGSVGNDGSGALLAGRPSSGGTTFPNRPGEHNISQHVGRACTTCHPFTSGDARHGWSNRQKSSAAQVLIVSTGTGIRSWNPTTKSCSPSCHGTQTW